MPKSCRHNFEVRPLLFIEEQFFTSLGSNQAAWIPVQGHPYLYIGFSRLGCNSRGSAKSGQVVGWVMSLMARFGRRDRDLVVEAIAAWAPWARRMRPDGQVAQGGHDLGAVVGAQLVAILIEEDVTDPGGRYGVTPSKPESWVR